MDGSCSLALAQMTACYAIISEMNLHCSPSSGAKREREFTFAKKRLVVRLLPADHLVQLKENVPQCC